MSPEIKGPDSVESHQGELYSFGPFHLSATEHVLRREDQIVALTPKCFDTLLVLARHGGNVVEKERLMRLVWPDSFVEEGNLAQNIFILRKTLGEVPGGGQYIQTIPKRGYRLVFPPGDLQPSPAPPVVNAASPPAQQPMQQRAPRKLSYVIAAGIAVASTLIAASWVLSPGSLPPNPRFTPLTVPNNIAYGVISPDGVHIAYVSHDDDGQSLWVRGTTEVGAGTRLVPPADGHFWGVSFSPGGEYLYYALELETHPADGILYRIPVQGGDPQKLTSGIAAAPSFAPRGARMVFKSYDLSGRGRLLTATAQGSDVKIIAQSAAASSFDSFQWSADGKSIYYSEATSDAQGSRWSLHEVPAAGGAPRVLMPPQARPLHAVNWLNRSRSFALIPDADSGIRQIWQVDAGGSFRRLTNDLNQYSLINLTADSRVMLANSITTHDSIWTAPAPGVDRSVPERISLPAGTYNNPVWTPDGHVVFVGQSNVWLSTVDGRDRKPLIPEKIRAIEPVVSADGRFVVFVVNRAGSSNLWRTGMDGTGFRQLTTGTYDWHPAISPDSKWLVYASRLPGRRALLKVPLDSSGSPVELVGSGGSSLAISPDSRLFAYRTEIGEVEVRSLNDGSLLRTMPAPADPSDFHWSKDGKTLTYASHSGRAVQLWSQPIDGGKPVRVGELPSDIQDVDWSPDARRILYLRREYKVDLALITGLW